MNKKDDLFNFKIASQDWEFAQIHKLNYQTFVEEISQHQVNESGLLVDKFHNENTYIICLKQDELIGMLTMRGKRPFSIDQKLVSVDKYLPQGRSLCEIRLLSVKKEYRNSRIFADLVKYTSEVFITKGYDLAIISGILNKVKLYRRLGFTTFGPVVGTPPALFQPMYLALDTYLIGAKKKYKSLGIFQGISISSLLDNHLNR